MTRPKRSMLQNVTLSADKELIQLARARAQSMKSTLNDEFRGWLQQFARATKPKEEYLKIMEKLSEIDSGRKFQREEFYE